jgi:hypothetical protein
MHQHVIVWTRMSITTKLSKTGYQLECHMIENLKISHKITKFWTCGLAEANQAGSTYRPPHPRAAAPDGPHTRNTHLPCHTCRLQHPPPTSSCRRLKPKLSTGKQKIEKRSINWCPEMLLHSWCLCRTTTAAAATKLPSTQKDLGG